MKELTRIVLSISLVILGGAVSSYGQLPESDLSRQLVFGRSSLGFGARALAMGGAFTALADDITAMSYNPAGLAQIIKPEISVGGNYSGLVAKHPALSLSNPSWNSIEFGAVAPQASGFAFDYVGLAVPFRIAGIPVVLGVAYQNRISNILQMEYARPIEYSDPVNWAYAGIASSDVETSIFDNSGGVNTTTLSLAIRPVGFLHIGANLNLNRMNMVDTWNYRYEASWHDSSAAFAEELLTYNRTDTYEVERGISYDAGALLKFNILSLGVVYKKGWHARLSNPFSYQYSYTDIDGLVTTDTGSGDDPGELFWPYSLNAGLSLRPVDALTLAFDYNFTKWSDGQIVWDGYLPWGFPLIDGPQDTQVFRAGLEYLTFLKAIAIPIRVGGFRDRLIGHDASGNDINFWGATFGTGIAAKNSVIDIAAIYHFGSYDMGLSEAVAVSKISNWRIVASLTFRFGR